MFFDSVCGLVIPFATVLAIWIDKKFPIFRKLFPFIFWFDDFRQNCCVRIVIALCLDIPVFLVFGTISPLAGFSILVNHLTLTNLYMILLGRFVYNRFPLSIDASAEIHTQHAFDEGNDSHRVKENIEKAADIKSVKNLKNFDDVNKIKIASDSDHQLFPMKDLEAECIKARLAINACVWPIMWVSSLLHALFIADMSIDSYWEIGVCDIQSKYQLIHTILFMLG